MKTNTFPWGKKTSQIEKKCPMHFPPLDEKKSNPSHEFAGYRKKSTSMMMMLLPRLTQFASMTSKQTSGQTNRMTYFPRFAFNLS